MSATRELLEIQIDGSQVIVGVFDGPEGAERAIDMLAADGFDPENVKVLVKSRAEAEELAPRRNPADNQALAEPEADRMQGQVAVHEEPSSSRINLGTGVGLVAGIGGGAATGLAILNVPGIGSLLSNSGPVVAMIVCGLIGGVLGAYGGSVAGISIPEEDTSYFTGDLDRGAYLVAVRTNRIDEALDLLRDAGARNPTDFEGGH